jgi:hypothetical protein
MNALLDAIKAEFNIKTDAALAARLCVQTSSISKYRHGILKLQDSFTLKVHEATDWPISRIRELAAKEQSDEAN